jgi:hypothetical protein
MSIVNPRAVRLDREVMRTPTVNRGCGTHQAMRLLVIGAACALTSACGGGGGGASDGTPVTPPPAAAELAWDNGNWDQQEWK